MFYQPLITTHKGCLAFRITLKQLLIMPQILALHTSLLGFLQNFVMIVLFIYETAMDDTQKPLILQSLLSDDSVHWQMHNCKILQRHINQDMPLGFLLHYDGLDDHIKTAYPLDKQLLKLMDTPMSIGEAANTLGIDIHHFKNPWHIKYVGSFVIYCEPLLLALRMHFGNTAKPTQTVYLSSPEQAWQQQCHAWRCFGVVDILTKGQHPIISVADDMLPLIAAATYQALPNDHSLSLTSFINEHKEQLPWLNRAILDHLLAQPIR